MIRKTYELTGIVQGIGLRPVLHRLAGEWKLGGSAQNRSGSVRLVLEGPANAVEGFIAALQSQFPPPGVLAALSETACESIDVPSGEFQIVSSRTGAGLAVVIPPDLRMCDDCRREVLDPGDRRFGYPFTTCTVCGPRYTVVEKMPYDRERTTLKAFPLCSDCRREYTDPADRRFHAESIACPACGPALHVADAAGRRLSVAQPLAYARSVLDAGGIVAVRGIGGYLLAADAANRETICRLRQRKQRPHKPFALMAASIETVGSVCETGPAAETLLASPAGPIVILPLRGDITESGLPVDVISPDSASLGVMLPTSPLHLLLFQPLPDDPVPPLRWLVMTSGNRRGEPLCITNEEAVERLSGLVDCFLMHNREINLRNDDSVCVLRGDQPQVWRRARGYAPTPLLLSCRLSRPVLALGAEMKNAIAAGHDDRVVLSPHVGDLDTPEALAGLRRVAGELPEFLAFNPGCIAVDLHPDMHSTRLGVTLARQYGCALQHVQHHHAHAAACLAEHGCTSGLAVTFDGSGYGADGNIWGAELLHVTPDGFRRLATFKPVALPGGDNAVRFPVRQFAARCRAYGIRYNPAWRQRLNMDEAAFDTWGGQAEAGINAPLTHAAGRLFDAFAVGIGAAGAVATYDGQPAIRLESAARLCPATVSLPELPFAAAVQDGMLQIDWAEAFRRAVERDNPEYIPRQAMALHLAVASAVISMVEYAFDFCKERTVALSGGVFMNEILTRLLQVRLTAMPAKVLVHHRIPPGDGCIAFGQAVIAGRICA